MKSVQFGLGVVALALVGVAPAHAQPLYVTGHAGATQDVAVNGIDLKDGGAYGVGVGSTLGPLRVEAGVDHLTTSMDLGFASVDASALDYHANAYADIPLGGRSSVFAGVGVDWVDASASAFGSSFSARGKGWNYAVGIATKFTDHAIGEIQLRHVSATLDSDFGDLDVDANVLTIGGRFTP